MSIYLDIDTVQEVAGVARDERTTASGAPTAYMVALLCARPYGDDTQYIVDVWADRVRVHVCGKPDADVSRVLVTTALIDATRRLYNLVGEA